MMKKYIAIAAILMFLATSISVASAKNVSTVISKAGGEPVTEYFNWCYIEYKDEPNAGLSNVWCFKTTKNMFMWAYIDCTIGNVTIKSLKKTLTVENNFYLSIRKVHPIMKNVFNVSINYYTSFFGNNNFPGIISTDYIHPQYWFKGIARGVEITYYQ